MPDYLVTWEITIDANNPRDAAEEALRVHRDPGSTATVFSVRECDSDEDAVFVDLEEEEDSL